MKSIIIFVLLLGWCHFSVAQAPQGINYQAVAYNSSGSPVINQVLGIRLSILENSAGGNLLYEETHMPTSDNAGVFSIVVGMGNVTTGSFGTIQWSNGAKWLKTEIDITGGTNYVTMGSSQFMSVPYALYANQTGFSSGSFTIPDGFDSTIAVVLPANTNYTVPAGKNLYISSSSWGVTIDNINFYTNVLGSGADAKAFLVAGENSIVNPSQDKVAFLVKKKVEWRTIDIVANGSFTIPAGKQFVVVNSTSNYASSNPPGTPVPPCSFTINGTPIVYWSNFSNTIFEAGTILSVLGCTAPTFTIGLNGYFKTN